MCHHIAMWPTDGICRHLQGVDWTVSDLPTCVRCREHSRKKFGNEEESACCSWRKNTKFATISDTSVFLKKKWKFSKICHHIAMWPPDGIYRHLKGVHWTVADLLTCVRCREHSRKKFCNEEESACCFWRKNTKFATISDTSVLLQKTKIFKDLSSHRDVTPRWHMPTLAGCSLDSCGPPDMC